MISDKIRLHHLERKALLYVRQSSAHQVLHNRESSALQYAMRDRLTALGWSEIEVIDDDLGRSAAGAANDGIEPWLNLSKAARLLHVSPRTLRLAAEAGEIDAIHPLPDGPWILSRAALSTSSAQAITERARHNPKYPTGSHPDQQSLFSSIT